MSDDPIYLDHNATTPVAPEVVEAMLPWLREHFGNPSSGHVYGRRARAAVEEARGQVAEAIGASPGEIVFTSCGTEANNLAMRAVAVTRARARHLVTSRVEHVAVVEPAQRLERDGWRVSWVGAGPDGVVDVDAVERAVTDRTALVSVMLANNETGAVQPIARIAARASAAGARMHTDAAQALGKIPIDVAALGVDLLTLVGHKAYAPKGVGALYVREGVELDPLLLGGGQERGRRPGTENVPYLVGFGVACALVRERLDADAARFEALRERLHGKLAAQIPGLARNADPARCLPNTLSVRFPGVDGAALLDGAPEIAASTGAACHEGTVSASKVILAMGLAPEDALGTVRLSVGRATTEDQVDRSAAALVASYERLRG